MASGRSKPNHASRRGVVAWLGTLDRVLRGEATRPSELRGGRLELPVAGLSLVLIVLAMLYGVCMGAFALLSDKSPRPMQMLASMVKFPALYALTVVVTLPSLYVFDALVGSRLRLASVVRLLIAALGVMLAVLASMGPIVAFFSVSTTSYPFMVLLNVVVCGLAGMLGLAFLLQTLQRLSEVPSPPPAEPPAQPDADLNVEFELAEDEPPGALDRPEGQVLGQHVKTVFRIWLVVFGLVGAQMSWVLRPFIGDPNAPFVWFRGRESSFFQAVFRLIGGLFLG